MRTIPLPTIMTFLTCRGLYDGLERVLIGPAVTFHSRTRPPTVRIGIFVEFTGGHATYPVRFEVRDVEENMVQEFNFPPFPAPDPIQVHAMTGHLDLQVPAFGRLSLLLYLAGEEVARRPIWVIAPPGTAEA